MAFLVVGHTLPWPVKCAMKKELWLFTTRFPYGFREAFLENELPVLCERFERVLIFPEHAEGALRPIPSNAEVRQPDYLQETTVPARNDTHAGEDVPIYATGPGAALFHGVQEQSYVFHAVVSALGWSEQRQAR